MGEKGIVFFCSKDRVDRDALEKELGLAVEDNNDSERPYAIFIPDEKFEQATYILLKNERNRL